MCQHWLVQEEGATWLRAEGNTGWQTWKQTDKKPEGKKSRQKGEWEAEEIGFRDQLALACGGHVFDEELYEEEWLSAIWFFSGITNYYQTIRNTHEVRFAVTSSAFH